METHRHQFHPNLASHQLPGADTATKFEAIRSTDNRFKLLLAEAARVGWPSGFCNDLYLHDRVKLEESPDGVMIWILRQNGTHLYPALCDTSGEASYYRRVIEYWSGDDKLNLATCEQDRARFYVLSETGLKSITSRAAKDAIRVDSPRPPPLHDSFE